ncbi:MAG: hypothetical protein LUO95_10205 [Methylococcaceae bacterium]|nr:hypothetical protein [Methylococcaceae bacterium]MDD1607167.1 hypothetical protein [Methylococcaceae bacterium]MDD1610938.1 hypothetical protein [Methylococcaceae bacterium]MDD1616475.1 hypothetical protein [Methylococcaceae bacterium]OYV17642.1 MAG: hypothetical protein CG439_1601 [Methylococcaceae bacterium NSP1-2]
MEHVNKEKGIAITIMERFEKQTLPDLLWIKGRVENGELLSDGDMEFLEQISQNATDIKPLIDAQTEWQSLYASTINLYEEIIAKALANQQAAE